MGRFSTAKEVTVGRHGIVGASLLAHGKARIRAAIAGLTALAMVLAMAVVGAFASTVAHADPAPVPVPTLALTAPDHSPLVVGDSVTLTGDWGPINKPAGGEVFTVTLPSVFKFGFGDGPVTGMGLDSYGTCAISGSGTILTCTLNGDHAGETDVKGTFGLKLEAIGTTDQESVEFKANSGPITVSLPGGSIGDGSTVEKGFTKTGELQGNKWSVKWKITIGGDNITGLGTVDVLDDLTGGTGTTMALCSTPAPTVKAEGHTTTAPGLAVDTTDQSKPKFTLSEPAGGFDKRTKYTIEYYTCTSGNVIDDQNETYINSASFIDKDGKSRDVGPVTVKQDWKLSDPTKSGSVLGGTDRYQKIRWTVDIPGSVVKGTGDVTLADVLGADQALCDTDTAPYGLALSVSERYGPTSTGSSSITNLVAPSYSKTSGSTFTVTLNSGKSYTFKDSPYVYRISYTTCVTTGKLPDSARVFTNQVTINNGAAVTGKATMPTWSRGKSGTINSAATSIDGYSYAANTTVQWNVTIPGQDIENVTGSLGLKDQPSATQAICTPNALDGTSDSDLKKRLGLIVKAVDQIATDDTNKVDLTGDTTVSLNGAEIIMTIAPPAGHFSREYQYKVSYTLCTASGGLDAPGTQYSNALTGAGSKMSNTASLSASAWGTGSGVVPVSRGSFALAKSVIGDVASRVGAADFTVKVTEIPPAGSGMQSIHYDLTVKAGETIKGLHALGSGWTIELEEATPLPSAQGVWQQPLFAAVTSGDTHVAISEGGKKATITPVPGGANVAVTLTNELNASYAVGDYVWIDANKNGIQDEGEKPLVGVKVELFDISGNSVKNVYGADVAATATDINGRYLFDELPAGTYKVKFTLTPEQAALYQFTVQDANSNGNDAEDSDANPATGFTSTFVLDGSNEALNKGYTAQTVKATEGIDSTWDAGVHVKPPVPPAAAKSYAVGDYTWIDSNKNGVQDAGEPVLPGVKVELLDATGGVVATTTTNAQGRYLFDELPAGTYQIRFTLTPAQSVMYSFTKADQGSDAKDSDANQATGLTATFVLDDSNTALTKTYSVQTVQATEGIDPTWDAGVITAPSVSVGDYVWYDANGNGRQDAGEPGIEGVTLCLVGPDGGPVINIHGNPVKPVQTDRDGKYTFDDLPVLSNGGTYTVCIDKAASKHALENYVPTKDGVGDRVKDSSTWTASTQKGDLTKDGQRDSTLDFGFVRIEVQGEAAKTYAVGDYVWIDTTYNAIQDRGEPVLAGVTVELLNAKGKVLATTKTDAKGRYLFDGLSAGTYQIRFRLTDAQAAKYAFVPANRGSDDAIDSDGVANASGAVAITAKFRLDDSNTALTKTYFRSIAASQGIDPTWDAGVVGIDVLGANQLEPLPGDTEVIPADGDIAYTGVPAWTMLTVALLLLAGGGALLLGARRRRGTR